MVRRLILLLTFGLALGCGNETDRRQDTRFTFLPSSETGVTFENKLTNSNDFNIIQYLYFYNGGGVAAGDINNDGLTDLYFSSNQEPNRLYLNKGNFTFEDITEKSGAAGFGNWKTGVTMADVNGDGYLDLYVCGVGKYKSFHGYNQLYINNRDLTFTEKAREYGLYFQGFSTQSAFFDYDNDGDLDMYLLNHSVHSVRSYGDVMLRNETDPLAGDRLFRNDLIPSGTAHFTEVTASAGIFSSQIGYGLGVAISDFNNDGFADIYVSNDFHENDYLYINNGDGTFRQELEKSMAHTSRFSMGNDVADIDEDGWNDVVTLDMFPSDEKVIKTTAGEDNYEIFQYKLRFGYHPQVSRNALQINLGPIDSGRLRFSDVAPIAGVAATDWSWAPLLADFDNDGGKDLFITNGIVGRPNDLDYINYISSDSAQRKMTDEQLFTRMPSGEVPNVFFRKTDGWKFDDVSKEWIGTKPGVSNGAAYSDLDNDGDLDLVVNNINAPASIMRNELKPDSLGFLKIRFEGELANRFGLGASVRLVCGSTAGQRREFHREQAVTRGWLSSVDPVMHIGLGAHRVVDSLLVRWPGGRFQVLTSVAANNTITLKQSEATGTWKPATGDADNAWLEVADVIRYRHQENDFNVMESQRLIPFMHSTRGPCLATGDVNGDRLEDVFVGGGQGQAGIVYLQTKAGKFEPKAQPVLEEDAKCEDTASALFDVDGDRDLDLMVGGGGEEFLDRRILIRLYINNGRGVFARADPASLQKFYVNASCIAPADVDNDGDLDVFIGGGVVTGRYGLDSDSFILVNDGKGTFKESPEVFEGKRRPAGMVQTAVWADVDGDKYPELVIAGEWMPTRIYRNRKGVLTEEGVRKDNGWWSSLLADDLDGDGDPDFIVGNFGRNGRIQIPYNDTVRAHQSGSDYIGMSVADLDANSSLDQIISYRRDGIRYPFISRDQLIKQVPSMKKRYLRYTDYARAPSAEIVRNAKVTERIATTLSSMYLETAAADSTRLVLRAGELPEEAQRFPVYAMAAIDINGDGWKDLLLGGNLTTVQPELWRQDAGYGQVLLGSKDHTGSMTFRAVPPRLSGFAVDGEVRSIQVVNAAGKEPLIFVARNNNDLLVFKRRKTK